MILGFRTTFPPFPPHKWLLLLVLLNLLIHAYSTNYILYEVLIYIYGMMMLINIKYSLHSLQWTVLLNSVLFYLELRHIQLTSQDTKIVFALICLIHSKVIVNSLK